MSYEDIKPQMIKLYKEGYSIRNIASQFNIHKNTASRLIKSEVELRNRGITQKNKEEIYNLKIQGLTIREINKKTGRGSSTIMRILKEYGESNIGENRKYNHLKDDFKTLYKDGLSLSKIAEKYGVNKNTVCEYLIDDEIERREGSIASRSFYVDDNYFDELTDYKRYILGRLFSIGSVYCVNTSYFINLIVSSKNEQDILDTVKDFTDKNEINYQTNNRDNTIRLRVNSKKLYYKMLELGMTSKISDDLKKYAYFWWGYFDISLSIHKSYIYIKKGWYENDIIKLLLCIGIDEGAIRNSGRGGIIIERNSEVSKLLSFYDFSGKIIDYLEQNKSTKWSNFVDNNKSFFYKVKC